MVSVFNHNKDGRHSLGQTTQTSTIQANWPTGDGLDGRWGAPEVQVFFWQHWQTCTTVGAVASKTDTTEQGADRTATTPSDIEVSCVWGISSNYWWYLRRRHCYCVPGGDERDWLFIRTERHCDQVSIDGRWPTPRYGWFFRNEGLPGSHRLCWLHPCTNNFSRRWGRTVLCK